MQKATIHNRELERIENLKSYMILDTDAEEEIDKLTRLASEICETPISLISLVDIDRQWFKSKIGLAVNETSRDVAFCAHAINETDDFFIVEDARKDNRFHDNPLVTDDPYVIFYAGVVLKGDNDLPLGALCVIDHTPRTLSDKQIRSLKTISRQVMNLFNCKRSARIQEELRLQLSQKNQELDTFASIAAHDLKSPLTNIMSAANLFSQLYGSQIDKKGNILIDSIEKSGKRLKTLIDGLLQFSKIDDIRLLTKTSINLNDILSNLKLLIGNADNVNISLKSELKTVQTSETLLDQILVNLCSNALKYSDKKTAQIELNISENDSHYLFSVNDDGPGIDKKHHSEIFNLFKIASIQDQFGNKGSGIGLATVKKIVEKLGGEIYVESDLGRGSDFHFSICK
jgi:signal transduction histidine kinase